MRSGSRGADGWSVEELKHLPDEFLDMLAMIFNEIERQGKWPRSLERALITLISKGQGAKPEDLRPISVMSVVYRLWAIRRLQDLRQWQETWASKGQHGYRPGHCPEDVFWRVSLRVERALLDGSPLYGISFDFKKCFDMVPHDVMFRLVEELGMVREILGPLRSIYCNLRRRFR
eukprot:11778566-Karenia_brevis.AAC.1